MGDTIQILIAMVIYMAAVIVIGIAFARKANASSDAYFLGGRSLGPWVTAMSAEASDMSGWLLMGLPGVAYWCGICRCGMDGYRTGSRYLHKLADRFQAPAPVQCKGRKTLSHFRNIFPNRFHEKRKVIMTIAAVFILIFFTVYAASCLVTCGKLFSTLFDMPYIPMMIVGAVFVLVYTLIGGFLAESASDFMQAVVMIVALVVTVIVGTIAAGGLGEVLDNARSIPGFLEFFGIATPEMADGVQQIVNGEPQFGAAGQYSLLSAVSNLAWGLGYFGVPQVLLRFMAIRSENELTRSRRIATVWVVISLTIAVVHRSHGTCPLSCGADNLLRCGECIHPSGDKPVPRLFWPVLSWQVSLRLPSAPRTLICSLRRPLLRRTFTRVCSGRKLLIKKS